MIQLLTTIFKYLSLMIKKGIKYFVIILCASVFIVATYLFFQNRYKLRTAFMVANLITHYYDKDTINIYHTFYDKTLIISFKHLADRVKTEGDSTAFNKLDIVYSKWGYGEILPYAIIMANKYNYPPAYLRVYEEIVKFHGGDIEKCPQEAKQIALAYLEQYNKLVQKCNSHLEVDNH